MAGAETVPHIAVGLGATRRRSAFSVLVCRGCCCGTLRKHPGVDHDAQVDVLTRAAHHGGGHCRVVDCLDQCSASNLVVVRRHDGAPAVWLGGVLSAADTDAVADWLATGADTATMPNAVAARVVGRVNA
jgi:hypothetical protein